MLAQGFKDDGLWLEGSIPYQFAETAPLVILAQMLENARYPEDLFRYRSPNGYSLKAGLRRPDPAAVPGPHAADHRRLLRAPRRTSPKARTGKSSSANSASRPTRGSSPTATPERRRPCSAA